jgi:hypothetical protein
MDLEQYQVRALKLATRIHVVTDADHLPRIDDAPLEMSDFMT